MLNMRSSDDRSTAARIRDAAITEFATSGVNGTTVRAIAAAADVSPGLVIHHFGSKDQLRVACDEYVAALIRDVKGEAMTSGAPFDIVGAFRSIGHIPAAKYLARTLIDGSPHVAELVDEIISDAVDYLGGGVAAGTIKPTEFEQERAAILAIWGLGALVMHEHVERALGVDITADFSTNPEAITAYVRPVFELYSQGLLTDQAAHAMSEALDSVSTETETKTP
ncbi:MAG: TetR/AcrR family transcriptional regulator [Acidimicrobiia bacterium]|nr:TetR/AcrR family transcriptional regulator [Acidimicrobiia bacterium]NNC76175.1 TetR family transcriptional regulator [Acidimicrobiia bacterium]